MIYERTLYSIYCDACNRREDVSIVGSIRKVAEHFQAQGWKQRTVYGSVRDFCSEECCGRD